MILAVEEETVSLMVLVPMAAEVKMIRNNGCGGATTILLALVTKDGFAERIDGAGGYGNSSSGGTFQ